MRFQLTSSVLTREKSSASFAWADLRAIREVDATSTANFDVLKVSAERNACDLLKTLLLAAPTLGMGYRVQCRVGHRPESPSRVRLHKGLFAIESRKNGAKTIEVNVCGEQTVLVGTWVFPDSLIDAATHDCFDQSTCCYLVSSQPLDQDAVLRYLAESLVVSRTSSINYPDLAERVCRTDAYLVRAHPQDREDVLLVGPAGSESQMRLWVQGAELEFAPCKGLEVRS
jgi:hypothetical protein